MRDEPRNTTSVEYGIRIEYPDGHIEYGECANRSAAHLRERAHNRGSCPGTATVVRRMIGVWHPLETAEQGDSR